MQPRALQGELYGCNWAQNKAGDPSSFAGRGKERQYRDFRFEEANDIVLFGWDGGGVRIDIRFTA